jgi:hypothetical protein
VFGEFKFSVKDALIGVGLQLATLVFNVVWNTSIGY